MRNRPPLQTFREGHGPKALSLRADDQDGTVNSFWIDEDGELAQPLPWPATSPSTWIHQEKTNTRKQNGNLAHPSPMAHSDKTYKHVTFRNLKSLQTVFDINLVSAPPCWEWGMLRRGLVERSLWKPRVWFQVRVQTLQCTRHLSSQASAWTRTPETKTWWTH